MVGFGRDTDGGDAILQTARSSGRPKRGERVMPGGCYGKGM